MKTTNFIPSHVALFVNFFANISNVISLDRISNESKLLMLEPIGYSVDDFETDDLAIQGVLDLVLAMVSSANLELRKGTHDYTEILEIVKNFFTLLNVKFTNDLEEEEEDTSATDMQEKLSHAFAFASTYSKYGNITIETTEEMRNHYINEAEYIKQAFFA